MKSAGWTKKFDIIVPQTYPIAQFPPPQFPQHLGAVAQPSYSYNQNPSPQSRHLRDLEGGVHWVATFIHVLPWRTLHIADDFL